MIEVEAATRFQMFGRPGDTFIYEDGKQVKTGILGEVCLHDGGTVGVVNDVDGNEVCRIPAGAPHCHTSEGVIVGTGGPAAIKVIQTNFSPPS